MQFEVKNRTYQVISHAQMDEYAKRKYPAGKGKPKKLRHDDAMLEILISVMLLEPEGIARYLDCAFSCYSFTNRPNYRDILEAVNSLEKRGGSLSKTASMIYFNIAEDTKTTLLQRLNRLLAFMKATISQSNVPNIERLQTYKFLVEQKRNMDNFVELMRSSPKNIDKNS